MALLVGPSHGLASARVGHVAGMVHQAPFSTVSIFSLTSSYLPQNIFDYHIIL